MRLSPIGGLSPPFSNGVGKQFNAGRSLQCEAADYLCTRTVLKWQHNAGMGSSFHLCYASLGVDVDHALKILATIPISLHCWQGDDVGGFENFGGTLGGGHVATGNSEEHTSELQ